jgi:flavin-dependent dehydrogenase
VPAAATEVELEVRDHARDRYQDAFLLDLLATRGGYGWIFGKAGWLSTGLRIFHSGRPADLRAALDRLFGQHEDLKGGIARLQRGLLIPFAGSWPHYPLGRVLLAGGATGLADPLTAEGISYALASDRRAGQSILAAL